MLIIRVQHTCRANYKPRSDRTRVASQRQDRHIRIIHLWNFMITAADTASRTPSLANGQIAGQTVCRRLRKSGHRARQQVIGPILKQHHRTVRLAWARARCRWRVSHLSTHPFCDESWFSLPSLKQWTSSCVPQAWGTFYRPVCVRVRPFWSRKCYVLGCAGICHDGRTQLKIVHGPLNAVKYTDNIIDPIGVPFLQQRNYDHVFQHDNARCHVARICQYFLNQNHSRVLPWPAFSPDMILSISFSM
jgi:hypothetical protein